MSRLTHGPGCVKAPTIWANFIGVIPDYRRGKTIANFVFQYIKSMSLESKVNLVGADGIVVMTGPLFYKKPRKTSTVVY